MYSQLRWLVLAALFGAVLLPLRAEAQPIAVPASARLDVNADGSPDAPNPAPGDGFCTKFTQAATGDGNAINTIALALHILNGSAGQPNRRAPDPTFSGIVRVLDTYNAAANTNGQLVFNVLLPWSQPVEDTGLAECASPGGPSGVSTTRLAALFRGNLHVPAAGTYTFGLRTDDGYRLRIGGTTIGAFDANRGPAVDTHRATFDAAGIYPIEIVYWDQGGLAVFEMSVAAGDLTFTSATSATLASPANSGVNLASAANTELLPAAFQALDYRWVHLPTWLPPGEANCADLVNQPSNLCGQPGTNSCGNGIVDVLAGGGQEGCDQFHILGGNACPAGWTGVRRCNNEPGYADGNGTCTLAPVASTCTDIDECAPGGANNCSADATCTNTDGGFTCACEDGFAGNGVTCTDIDECAPGGANNCSADATCTNTAGGFTCACDAGFTGNGVTCTDIDECAPGGANNCSADATCSNTDGGFTCACEDGFAGDGEVCVNVDECEDPLLAGCDPNAVCVDTEGSFFCACDTGYEGDGETCTDVDECAAALPVCDDNATCENDDGGFSCSCDPGFDGDGTACTPSTLFVTIDEPADGTTVTSAVTAVRGRGVPLQTVVLFFEESDVGEATVALDGNWEVTLETPVVRGTVRARAESTRGEAFVFAESTFTVLAAPPFVNIEFPVDGERYRNPLGDATGRSEAGRTLEATLNADAFAPVTIDTDGTWQLPLDEALEPGAYTLVVIVRDDRMAEFGTDAVSFEVLAPGVLQIDAPVTGSTVRTTLPRLRGIGPAGASILLEVADAEIATVVADGSGDWDTLPDAPLALGEVTVVASTTFDGEALEDSTTFTIEDAVAVVILVPADGSATNDTTPEVSGTAAPGAEISMQIDGDTIVTTTADENGQWTIVLDEPLADGDVTLEVTATDADGNVDTDVVTVLVDTVPPTLAFTEPVPDGDAVVEPVTRVAGTSEPGSTVQLFVDGTLVGTATVDEDGNWEVLLETAVGEGTYEVAAEATDRAGNVTRVEGTLVVEDDAPGDTGVDPDTGLDAGIDPDTGDTGLEDASDVGDIGPDDTGLDVSPDAPTDTDDTSTDVEADTTAPDTGSPDVSGPDSGEEDASRTFRGRLSGGGPTCAAGGGTGGAAWMLLLVGAAFAGRRRRRAAALTRG